MSEQINVLSELERIGWPYEWAGEDELKVRCPFHDDESPSCCINIEKRQFRCPVADCGKTGDFITFLARALEQPRQVILVDLASRYTIDVKSIIDPQTIERYHSAIWEALPLIKQLEIRGVTSALIRKYRLGHDKGRITIPIMDASGMFINVRRYAPGAPGKEKMRNMRGHGTIKLYPIAQLKYDTIVLCGGECKAIVAADQLNPHGIGAITATGGEGNWAAEFSALFKGKKVYVCMDVDEAGRKAAEILCKYLARVASWVGNLRLPLNVEVYPHGDVNDFIAQEHGELEPLLKNVEEWHPRATVIEDDKDPVEMTLVSATRADSTNKRFKLNAVISAMDVSPYAIPKQTAVECTQDQDFCVHCPAFNCDDLFDLHPESIALLEMVGAEKKKQRMILMEGLGIPIMCKVCTFKHKTFFNVEDVRVSPQLEITNRASDRVMQPAMCVGTGVELNETYELIGRMHPHPKTQQATLLISNYNPTKDALSSYECTDLDKLDVFKPDAWSVESIKSKLNDIYEDFEANVTRIYQRRNLHLVVDLAYHSPLFLDFDDRVEKGWVEVLILGDSSQGKSETTLGMLKHYGLGEKVECKNASVAGLLGGLQQMQQKWMVTWGVIPTHDKRLVVLEELKGASVEIIARLTDMRSSGIAEIPKIEKRRTHARTRLIALSNPRSDMQLSNYNFGVEAIKELIGALEDVRRFDFTLLVSSSEIDAAELNKFQNLRPKIEHRFDGDLCRSLILWAWTRETKEVVFENDATQAILQAATTLCDEFTEAIPLIDRGSTRNKIARLSAALAARTFSNIDHQTLLVRKCHVDFIVEFIRKTYSSHIFGYKDFTDAIEITQTLLDPDMIKKNISDVPFPADFIKQMLHTTRLDLQDIQDWCAWDQQDAKTLLSLLVRKHGLQRDGRHYRKTPRFIGLLKDMLLKGEYHDRPEHIEEF